MRLLTDPLEDFHFTGFSGEIKRRPLWWTYVVRANGPEQRRTFRARTRDGVREKADRWIAELRAITSDPSSTRHP